MTDKKRERKILRGIKLTIEEEEKLAFHVKKYPCLFDKTDKGHKQRDCVGNSWQQAASALEYINNFLRKISRIL